MSPFDAMRWLEYQARQCHDRDAHEALCLLLPALLDHFGLPPIDDPGEADALKYEFKTGLAMDEFRKEAA